MQIEFLSSAFPLKHAEEGLEAAKLSESKKCLDHLFGLSLLGYYRKWGTL